MHLLTFKGAFKFSVWVKHEKQCSEAMAYNVLSRMTPAIPSGLPESMRSSVVGL